MFLRLGVYVILASLCNVDCLTCLQCSNIQSPRHCKHVTECSPSEICHVNQKMNEYGEVLFDIGCTHASSCSNRSHGSQACDYCCNSNLCNAAVCGQQGYPSNRGPICYSCSTQTNPRSCSKIDFCRSNEVCSFQEEREFDDSVYTTGCVALEQCEHNHLNILPPIVGRSFSEDQRSITETMCHLCCHGDLCNSRCGFKDCKEVRLFTHVSGVYIVRPEGSNQDIEVYCDLETDGGGWTVFQRRVNGSVDFYQNFLTYENGFGDVHGEFWLGLKYIYAMTLNAPTELRIDVLAANGTMVYEVFPNFRLSEAANYTLHVDKGHGTAGEYGGFLWHSGQGFHTYDHDDENACARQCHGGWWYRNCALVSLNGQYVIPGTIASPISKAGLIYFDFQKDVSMKETRMMFRRV